MSALIHTCYRVLDLERSITFYEGLGLKEMGRLPIGDEAVNAYLGFEGDGPRLELTFNFGRKEPYEIGSGYGHIAIQVDDLDRVLARLSLAGVEPEKPPYTVAADGPRLCFVRDPDGYRVELIEKAG
ncbi:MAG: VOC family protein [Solirubrobacterales bacterium]